MKSRTPDKEVLVGIAQETYDKYYVLIDGTHVHHWVEGSLYKFIRAKRGKKVRITVEVLDD